LPRWKGFQVGRSFGSDQSCGDSEPSAGSMNLRQISAGKVPPATAIPWTLVIGISPAG